MKKWILLLLIGLLSNYGVFAQMTKDEIELTSTIYNKKRKLSIFLPSRYEIDTTKQFDVMYVLDAQYEPYTQIVSSLVEYYSNAQSAIPFIIVGIHSPNRWDDFLPNDNPKGGSAIFSQFLNQEVESYLVKNYRVGNMRVGVGHSLGGTLVLQEMIQSKSLFQAGIIISPNMVYSDNELAKHVEQYFESKPETYRYFYVRGGTADQTEQLFTPQIERTTEKLMQFPTAKEMWNYLTFEGQNHMSTFPTSFLDGYLQITNLLQFSSLSISNAEKLEDEKLTCIVKDFYKQKAKLLQEKENITAEDILQAAVSFRESGDYKAALRIVGLAKEILESEMNLDVDKKLQMDNRIYHIENYSKIMLMQDEAMKFYSEGKIEESVETFKQAFALNYLQATHGVRINAVPILALAGEKELAFEQLDLLSNKFKLQGNHRFINDERCASLHKDKRWKKYMQILEENGK